LTQEIALGSDLLFDVVQVADGREFRVSAPQDVSSLVRWDIANNQLSKSKYGYSAPGVTRVFVAGQGEGSERTIVEVTTAASLLSEAIWGRIERFVDQRNTDDVDELTQAGLEVLATEGTTVTSLEVVPSSAMADGFGVDWFLGSWVTVVVNDQQIRAQVVEVPISITSSDGVLVGAVVGDATGFDWQAILAAKQSKTEKRVSALEQNAEKGAAVVVVTPGLVPIVPPTFSTSGGTSSRSRSTVTFSGVSSISLNNIFSGAYQNYRLVSANLQSSAAGVDIRGRFRVAGADQSQSTYASSGIQNAGTGVYGISQSGATYAILGLAESTVGRGSMSVEFFGPALSQQKQYFSVAIGGQNGYQRHHLYSTAAVVDGLTLFPSSGTFSGSFTVYGYNS
jgi:hypothetical protein